MTDRDGIGSWDEDREHKYVVGTSVSVEERLAWLEQMLELALASGALPKPRDAWGQPIPVDAIAGVARRLADS
jgi:hypothetical protein